MIPAMIQILKKIMKFLLWSAAVSFLSLYLFIKSMKEDVVQLHHKNLASGYVVQNGWKGLGNISPVEHLRNTIQEDQIKVVIENSYKVRSKLLDKGAIIIANHSTPMDMPHICAVVDSIKGRHCAKVLTVDVPYDRQVNGYTMNLVGLRSNNRLTEKGKKTINNFLDSGGYLLIFPAGHTIVREFKPGFLIHATRKNLPILPVRLEFKYPLWFSFAYKLLTRLFGADVGEYVFHKYACKVHNLHKGSVFTVKFGDPIPADYSKYSDVLLGKRKFTQDELEYYSKAIDNIRHDLVHSRFMVQ